MSTISKKITSMKREKEFLEDIVSYIDTLTDNYKFKYFKHIYSKELKEVFKTILKLELNEIDFLNDFFYGKFTSKMAKVFLNKISNIESYPKDIEWAKSLTKSEKQLKIVDEYSKKINKYIEQIKDFLEGKE